MLVTVRNVSQHKSQIRGKQSSFLETQKFSGIYILILVFLYVKFLISWFLSSCVIRFLIDGRLPTGRSITRMCQCVKFPVEISFISYYIM